MTPFPWRPAMQFGFGVLRLAARDFWSLTPRELAAAFDAYGPVRTAPPRRDDLATLMERFPDGR